MSRDEVKGGPGVDLDDWDGDAGVDVVLLVVRVAVRWLGWSPRETSGAP
jgi:hypothetical protein